MASYSVLQSRTQPPRHVRRQRRYLEPDSNTDTDQDSPRSSTRPARSSRHIRSYREDSDSSSDHGVQSYDSSTTPTAELDVEGRGDSSTLRHQANAHKRKRKTKTVRSNEAFASYKRKKVAQPIAVRGKANIQSTQINFPVRERAPLWQSLEYQIWFKILQYAAHPVSNRLGSANASVGWLLEVSRLCRIFHESAIAVLTRAPPLLPCYRAYGLLGLLLRDPKSLTLNYAAKIHTLEIDSKQLLVPRSGIDLEAFIGKTPLLRNLRIFHPHDELVGKFIWAQALFGRDKWAYGNLLDVMDLNKIRLHSFEWNGRYRDTVEVMLESSARPCISSIRNLKLVNFALGDREEEKRSSVRDCTVSSIKSLQLLETLELIHCNIIDAQFMSQLPLGLSSLVIVNSQSLTSDALQNYLSTGGKSLVQLHLAGNQVMDLGFMSNLRECCPILQGLSIDLTYEDSSSYRDRDPLYDHLLPQGRPSWPVNLQSIVVGPLRSLSVTDAEEFYQSLIDAAPQLPLLREISMKTILNDASWRDRARMRSKWAAIFDYVFLANYDEVQQSSVATAETSSSDTKDSTRKSTRIQELEDFRFSESFRKSHSEIDEIIDSLPQHRRCERVTFELSDQRPAQEQYREEDFLDDEPSGDEEWHEG